MPLPPKGDPQRPLRLAIRSTRSLGIILVCVGILPMLPRLFRGLPPLVAPRAAVMQILLYFGPGALYILCSVFLRQRRAWAVTTAMILAGLHLLLFCGVLVVAVVSVLSRELWRNAPFVWVPLGAFLIFAFALAQLEYHLARSFEAIRRTPADAQRGFEPLPVMPARPHPLPPQAPGYGE